MPRTTPAHWAQTDALCKVREAAEAALAAAHTASKIARLALERHIEATGACPLCKGDGVIQVDRQLDCCSGYEDGRPVCGCNGMPIWQPYEEDCPFGCDPAPPDLEQVDSFPF